MGKFDTVVRDFFDSDGGELIAVSEDSLLFRTLRTTFGKILGIKSTGVHNVQDQAKALKVVREKVGRNIPLVMFVERMLRGRPSTEYLLTVKQTFPEVKLIVLTEETTRDNLIYLHEIGVNNIITKPASADNLIEKIAFTIKPAGNLSKLVDQAKELLAKGQPKLTLDISEKILEIKPGSPIGLMLKGDAKLAMGESIEAIKAYEEAHRTSKLFLDPLKRLAEAYKGEGDHDSRLKALKKLDQLSPLNTDRKYEIGTVYVQKGEVSKAEHFFDEAIECATREMLSSVGNITRDIAATLGEISPDLSEKYLTRFLDMKGDRLSSEDMDTFNRLGIALRKQGKWKEAVDNYQRALQICSDDEGLYYNMAMAYLEGGQVWEAARSMDGALNLNPNFTSGSESLSYNVAYIYSRTRSLDKAKLFCQKALKANPEHKKAKELLAQIKAKQ